MKTKVLFMVLVLSSSTVLAQKQETPLGFTANTLSFTLSGGASIPVSGKYDAALKMKDLLETGPAFGGSIAYSASPLISLRGTFNFDYNFFESKYRPSGKKPAFVAPTVMADVIFKFGSLIPDNSIFNPYVDAGVGLYIWKFSEDKIGGEAMTSTKGNALKKTSFGLHTGAGIELNLLPNLSFFTEGQYRYIFSKDENDFGENFENMGFIKLGGGLTYYFSLL